mgnify:CR=1 FL=1
MVGLKGKDKEVLSGLKTEGRNPRTLDLDLMSVGELLTVMNEEDKNVIEAVKQVLPQVRETVEAVIRALNQGGRLVYAGAGTSGRLGILDAVECLPTFPPRTRWWESLQEVRRPLSAPRRGRRIPRRKPGKTWNI